MNRKLISHSEVEALLQCEQKHHNAHVLNITSKSHAPGLQRGTDGHAFFETFFKALLKGKTNEEAKMEAVLATAGLLYGAEIIPKCILWVDKVWPTLGWKIVAVELELRVAITETLVYPCKIDLIIEIQGKLYIVDHKFLYDFYSQQMIDIFTQLPKYAFAARQHGFNITGAIYNMIRTRNVKEFDDKYLQLSTEINETRMKRAVHEQITTMKRIEQGIPDPMHTTNKMNCGNCQFSDLCAEELSGKSTKLMREAFFENNSYGYEDV